MRHKVFVYGTLMMGELRNDNLARDVYLGRGSIAGDLFYVGGGSFPAAVQRKDRKHGRIQGEVWEVSEVTLRHLDRIESFFPSRPDQSMYIRKRVLVQRDEFANGRYAYAYFWNAGAEMLGAQIESGDWHERPARHEEPEYWKQGGGSWSW